MEDTRMVILAFNLENVYIDDQGGGLQRWGYREHKKIGTLISRVHEEGLIQESGSSSGLNTTTAQPGLVS